MMMLFLPIRAFRSHGSGSIDRSVIEPQAKGRQARAGLGKFGLIRKFP
jgi:hypothetical protein